MIVNHRVLVLCFLIILLILSSTIYHLFVNNWLMLRAIQPDGFSASLVNETLMNVAGPSARGYMFYRTNQLDRALDSWEEATKLAPQNPVYVFWQGIVSERLGYNESAITAWRQANASRYWAWLSSVATQEGAIASAHELAERSILIDPNDKESRFILGEMYFRIKDWSRAVESLSVVLESQHQDSQYYSALMLRGQAYMEMSNSLDKAHSDFILASRLRPQDPWSYIRLCQVLGLLHKLKDAVSACEQATGLAEDSAFAHYYLGWAFFLDGQFTAAAAEFERSLELDPNLQAAQEWLAKTQNRK